MIHPPHSTEPCERVSRSSAERVLVSDGLKSIYVNWQGPPLSGGSSSGPVVRYVLTGRRESISAIARAEIGNPDYAVNFSPLPKAEARLEVARATRPAAALSIPRRSRRLRVRPPDGLRTRTEAADKLGCSVKTLDGYVDAGALNYVAIGHGKKRPRKMFTDADLDEFITNQTRKDVPCPSTRTETVARRTSISTSKCEVIGFTARRNARRGVKPKR